MTYNGVYVRLCLRLIKNKSSTVFEKSNLNPTLTKMTSLVKRLRCVMLTCVCICKVCYVLDAFLSPYVLLSADNDNSRCIVMSVFLHYFFLAQFSAIAVQVSVSDSHFSIVKYELLKCLIYLFWLCIVFVVAMLTTLFENKRLHHI